MLSKQELKRIHVIQKILDGVLAQVEGIEEAIKFLHGYLTEYNRRFPVKSKRRVIFTETFPRGCSLTVFMHKDVEGFEECFHNVLTLALPGHGQNKRQEGYAI